jgi:hypothetical protein
VITQASIVDDNYEATQAVLACVSAIYADESWTIQVLAAAVIAEHELIRKVDPAIVRQTLADGLRGRMIG